MYKVCIVGETKDGVAVNKELGIFPTYKEAWDLCFQLNDLLVNDLRLIQLDLLEWRFDVMKKDNMGMWDLHVIIDSDNEIENV